MTGSFYQLNLKAIKSQDLATAYQATVARGTCIEQGALKKIPPTATKKERGPPFSFCGILAIAAFLQAGSSVASLQMKATKMKPPGVLFFS